MENNKGKVFLIYPPAPVMNREDRCQQPTDDLIVIPPLPPSDLMYLASIAREEGFEPKIKDYSLKGETVDDVIKDIAEFKPDYLVLNAATPTINNDLSILEKVKEKFPKIITIAKGAHFNTLAKETLNDFPALDIAIMGEAELTLKEILSGGSLSEILGTAYKMPGGAIQINEKRPFNNELDNLPYPARDLVDNNLYRRPDTGEVQAVIKVSRGCPFHCFFCLATPVSGAKVRYRSPENILGEIRECYEKYNIKNFIFWSDIFNLDKEWVHSLCNLIIKSGLKITFSTNSRADTADSDTVELMKKAGCKLVSIGVESGSQYMLDKMGKKITLDDIKNTVKLFKKKGIKVYAYYVLGLPWESEETARETINFSKKLNTHFVSYYTATALCGTRFYDYIKEHNLGSLNYDMPYFYPSVNTHHLTKERVFELHKQAVKEYYIRIQYILMMLFSIRTFAEFKNYFKAGLRVLFRNKKH